MISYELLLLRKKSWLNHKIKFLIGIFFVASGLFGPLILPTENGAIIFKSLLVPPAYLVLDELFKLLSFRLKNRDFRLWIVGSNEVDYKGLNKESGREFEVHDKLISIGIFLLIIFLSIVAIRI